MPRLLRHETTADHSAVYAVHRAAFDSSAEADLVNALRASSAPHLSLVAEQSGCVVGHLMASPVTIDVQPTLTLMGIAPLAVLPAYQRQGIGHALIEACIAQCRNTTIDALIVLGHPGYYSRFGFVAANRFGFRSEYDVPDDVFMTLELRTGTLNNIHNGIARYHTAFAQLD